MKYAIVESGGKQYVAREGEAVEVDRLALDEGAPVEFDRVLLAVDEGSVRVGNPLVQGLKVYGTAAKHVQGEKVIVFRYIPKERYRRKMGHRQQYTRVLIRSIGEPGARPARAEAKPVKAPAAVKEPAPAAKPKAESKPKAAAPSAKKAPAPKPKPSSAKPKPAAKKK